MSAGVTTGDPNVQKCTGTGCDAWIRWVITVGDKRMPLDVEPDPDGNVVPVVTPTGERRVRVLGGSEMPAQGKAYRSHFQTCPASPQFRAKAWRTAPKCRVCGMAMDVTLARREGWTTHPACDPREALAAVRSEIRPTITPAEPEPDLFGSEA